MSGRALLAHNDFRVLADVLQADLRTRNVGRSLLEPGSVEIINTGVIKDAAEFHLMIA